jgi:hypothetical protein
MPDCLKSTTWLKKLARLADIFTMTDDINLSLQGRNISIFIIKSCLFPTSNKFLAESEIELEGIFFSDLQCTVLKCVPFTTDDTFWMRNPFSVLEMPDMSVQDYQAFRGFTIDFTLKQKFSEPPCNKFWCSFLQEYPTVSQSATVRPLPSPTTNLCEVIFSWYAATDIKYQNRLDIAPKHEGTGLHHHSKFSVTC